MNARDSIKPKTIRLAILMALADGAIATIDDLQARMGEPRAKIANNVHPTMAEGLIKRLRDDVTSLPAYQITPNGREFMASFSGRKAESAEKSIITPGVKVEIPAHACLAPTSADLVVGTVINSELAAKDAEIARTSRAKDILVIERDEQAVRINEQQAEIDRITDELAEAVAMLELIPEPVGYVIQRPAKPLVRFSKAEKAQAQAMSFARSGQRVQVFAMVPAGVAVPGAEWRPA